jgi:2-polyprenyl-6-methoxyphenol hydroxylase-like FAD-dependent oxidoreductase
MYDAIVVGARCAGSPTAMLLARNGHRVLLLDRALFPSDTMSVHYIHQPGIARLARWGLLQQVIDSGCPAVPGLAVNLGPFALSGSPPPYEGCAFGYAPRRFILDKILIDAAAAAGAEVRERFIVEKLVFDGDRVVGITGHSPGEGSVTKLAKIVIGADGMHSLVARSVGAEEYHTRPSLTCAYYSYWEDLPVERAELYPRPGRMIVVGPTNHNKTLVIVYWPVDAFTRVRADIEASFMAALDEVPELGARARAGRRTEPFRGTKQLQNFYRKPFGPGWALVGDAGYHKDPITAQGITDAFRDAELLANAIHQGLTGSLDLDAALHAYESERNAATMPMYDMTLQHASLQPPPPEMQQLMGALIHNQEQTNRFLGTMAGTVPIPEFFAPEHLGKLLSAVTR